ncbi:hypothetical protein F750_0810 [Streptomyces sp. PAMC 26508]|nr:hypothetical protein F750_0810 [Streptomyces sp. PAMC 26508]
MTAEAAPAGSHAGRTTHDQKQQSAICWIRSFVFFRTSFGESQP